MATVDTLNLEVKTNAEQAATGIRNLTKALNNMYRNLADDKKIGNLSRQFANLNSALNGISESSLSKVERLATALSTISKTNVALKTVSKSVADATKMPESIKEVSTNTIGNSGKTTSISPSNDATEQAKKYSEALIKLKESTKKCGEQFKKSTMLVTKFVRALGRVAFYRAVRFVLKSIVDSIKQGLNNLVEFSAQMNSLDDSHANQVFSEYASSFLYFKNAIATAVMPVIALFKDRIVEIINKLVDLINVIAQVTAALNGQSTYTKANYVWVDYANSMDKATGSAKKLAKQLAGFDELNNLTTNEGSGSGKTELDTSDMFTAGNEISTKWLEVANKIKDIFDKIKEALPLIALGLLSWAVSDKLATFIAELLGLSALKRIGLTIGLTILIGSLVLLGKNLWEVITEGINDKNFLGTILGAIGVDVGGLIVGIFFGSGGIGLGIASVISGVVVAIGGVVSTIKEGLKPLNSLMQSFGFTTFGAGIGLLCALIGGGLSGPLGALLGAAIGLVVGEIGKMITSLIHNFNDIKQNLKNLFDRSFELGLVVRKFIDMWKEHDFISAWVFYADDLLNKIKQIYNIFKSIMQLAVGDYLDNSIMNPSHWKDAKNSIVSGAKSLLNIEAPQTSNNNTTSSWGVDTQSLSDSIGHAVSSALSSANLVTNVTLQGDANGLFKTVQTQASAYKTKTGRAAF